MNSVSGGPHFHNSSGSVSMIQAPSLQASPFSAFHILRSYNYFLPPETAAGLDISTKHFFSSAASRFLAECPVQTTDVDQPSRDHRPLRLWHQPTSPTVLPFTTPSVAAASPFFNTSSSSVASTASLSKRQRGEKKPIPEDQKDDKYFERRRRNNQAAKKSRDARKIREDQVAFKATILEHENAILRAQILTLREETSTLRQLLMEKKVGDF